MDSIHVKIINVIKRVKLAPGIWFIYVPGQMKESLRNENEKKEVNISWSVFKK